MNILFKKIVETINEEVVNINQKIIGTSFLEILKFKILEKINDQKINNSIEDIRDINNSDLYENENKIINFKLIHNNSPKININTKLNNNLLLICINESIDVGIEDIISKKFINVNLIPYTGVVLAKNTICNLNYKKNSIVLEINYEDRNTDVEISK
tara:strand:- start:357 stop:827 length:471 start_codon:yes stop_codon:yes gene_type:complete